MKILIIDNGTKHLTKLKELIHEHEFIVRSLFEKYNDADDFDLIILSGGSRLSILDAPEVFTDEISLIRKFQKPIIGICEGCELIAYTYGSELTLIDHKTKGIKRIEMLEPNILNLPKILEVYEAHHFAVTKLGTNLEALAKSSTGYEIIKHSKKPIFGLQFHPEMFVDKSLGDDVFRKILKFVTPSK